MAKITREKFKVKHNVFDEFTERTIFKLITSKHIDGLIGPISIGKEANVFQAKKGKEKRIVKIYRLENRDFNRMYDYIKCDPRFLNMKKQRRQVIFTWAQREYRNLLKARKANVSCPIPYAFSNNVLVMEFIGADQPAPKLKDTMPDDPKKFFSKIVSNLKNLYKAGLVHSDISSFNILNDHEMPVIIDWSQCTTIMDPNADEYLTRDIKNIVNYFNKIGLKTSVEQILKKMNRERQK